MLDSKELDASHKNAFWVDCPLWIDVGLGATAHKDQATFLLLQGLI